MTRDKKEYINSILTKQLLELQRILFHAALRWSRTLNRIAILNLETIDCALVFLILPVYMKVGGITMIL